MPKTDLTDEQINEELARVMGWKQHRHAWETPQGKIAMLSPKTETVQRAGLFDFYANFATSRDAFHTHIVPVLEERGLLNIWGEFVARITSRLVRADVGEIYSWPAIDLEEDGGLFLTTPPRTLCLAAIEVMGDK
jgi:hypothetical protein